ncbi:MAG: DUF2087 domain-containing protein [Spirochaetales bacterium]|nr:DUF2087 domain-containing protein [Spirochaetales bacterium]
MIDNITHTGEPDAQKNPADLQELNRIFWDAGLDAIVKGYVFHPAVAVFRCLVCGKRYEKGIIYDVNGLMCDAEKALKLHIDKEHGSLFQYLIGFDKKLTGLSEQQKNILTCMYEGLNDRETAEKLTIGSISTVRNHRYQVREKEKQATIFLALMRLLKIKNKGNDDFITIHKGATMIDSRYAITDEEREKFLNRYFPDGLDGALSEFPKKEKRKLVILNHIIKRFELNRKYTEKEVNDILIRIYTDYVTIRRYLIEYGFMERYRDCSYYWVKV